jgi:hypothetical protein
MRRAVENFFAAREKIRTGRPTFAVGNHFDVRAVNVHRENLVAFQIAAFRLENKFFAVG